MGDMKLCGAALLVKIGNSSITQFNIRKLLMERDLGFVKIIKDHEYGSALEGETFFILEGLECYYIDTPGMTFTIADMIDEPKVFDLTNVLKEIL